MFAGTLVTLFALTVVLEPAPWYTPRYAIPLLGMIVGNVMTGASLALNDIGLSAGKDRNAIEAQLALGATRWQALKPVTRRALRSGFIPIVNAMAATGVVSLPGMMTSSMTTSKSCSRICAIAASPSSAVVARNPRVMRRSASVDCTCG